MPLTIDFNDIIRATLDKDCGNEGFIGIAPDGVRYHVVVPVDRQIARGIKAGNRPQDGTPFGGYKGWHYFCCPGYKQPRCPGYKQPCCPGYKQPALYDEREIQKVRWEQAETNARLIKVWASGIGIELEIEGGFNAFAKI